MDDVWGNAWGDPTESSTSTESTLKLGNGWHTEPSDHDLESDVAVPSWSTGTGISWDEPSESPALVWTGSTSDNTQKLSAWHTDDNPFISGLSAKRSQSLTPEPTSPAAGSSSSPVLDDVESETPRNISPPPEPSINQPAAHEDEDGDEDENEVPISSHPEPELSNAPETPPAPSSPQISLSSPTSEPDPSTNSLKVGVSPVVFTEDTISDVQVWSPPATTFAEHDEGAAWGSAWAAEQNETSDDEEEKQVDEWELAKEQKRRRDRKIPPELLSNVVSAWTEYADERWPKPPPSDGSDWRDNLRDGLQGVESVQMIMKKVDPPGHLALPINYRKTAVSKATAQALRFTKHVPIAQISPMSRFLAAKGSSAWELSVKARVENVSDDVPAGWRVVEPEAAPQESAKETKGARFMSFWSRRSSTVPVAKPVTPTTATTPALDATATHNGSTDVTPTAATPSSAGPSSADPSSGRPSVDTARSSTSGRRDSMATVSTTHALTEPPLKVDFFTSEDLSSNAAPDSTATPPSAVSRFLGRFSRKSTIGSPTASKHPSLALSSDDLEFLSDVPSANDGGGDDDDDIRALSAFVRPNPHLATKLPPPLAPPPPPSVAPPTSSNIFESSSGSPKTSKPSESFDSTFGDFLGSAKPSNSSSRSPPTSTGLSNIVPILPSPPISRPPSGMRNSSASPAPDSSRRTAGSPLFANPPQTLQHSQASIRAISPPLIPSPPPPLFASPAPPPVTLNFSRAQTLSAFDDDDTFSDFASSSSTFGNATSTSSNGLSNHTSLSFDDFDDFVSGPMSSPPPPPIPSKNMTPQRASPLRLVPSSSSLTSPRRQGSITFPPAQMRPSASASSSNLNGGPPQAVMSKAPPKPSAALPMALPPPPGFGAPTNATHVQDLLDGDLGFSSKSPTSHGVIDDLFGFGQPPSSSSPPPARSPTYTAPPIPVLSPPPLALPPRFISPPPPPPSAAKMNPPAAAKTTLAPPIRPSATPSSANGKKGLSAQDLSFFEGL